VGNFGAKGAFEAALRLETMGRRGDLIRAQEAYAVLEEEIERLRPALVALGEEEDENSLNKAKRWTNL
jgi:hypothetical protein